MPASAAAGRQEGDGAPPQPAARPGPGRLGVTANMDAQPAAETTADSGARPLHQPPSLQDAALKYLSRHLEVFADRRNRDMTIPVANFLRVLNAAPAQDRLHAADLMLRIVSNLPCLDCPEVDDAYWRPVAEASAGVTTCPIVEPYPALVARLRRVKQSLEAWVAQRQHAKAPQRAKAPAATKTATPAHKCSPPPSTKRDANGKGQLAEGKGKTTTMTTKKQKKKEKELAQKQCPPAKAAPAKAVPTSSPAPPAAKKTGSKQPPGGTSSSSSTTTTTTSFVIRPATQEEQQTALRMLKELDRAPASARLLGDTRAADAVTLIAKLEEPVAPAPVIKAARALRRKWKGLVKQEEGNKQAADGGTKGGDHDDEEDELTTALGIGRRAVAVRTWRQVYEFVAAYEARRRSAVGKRAQALAAGHEAGRHRTKEVEAWTADDEERDVRRASKRPPPGNTERIRKMLRLPAPVKPKERPFGGLVFVPNKKKKLKLKL